MFFSSQMKTIKNEKYKLRLKEKIIIKLLLEIFE